MIRMYSLEVLFPKLLRESPYYEPDPSQADFYYVHVWLYHHGPRPPGGGDFCRARVQRVIQALREAGPWWELSNATHIFPLTTDMGFCTSTWEPNYGGAAPLLRHSILLQHYGRVTPVVERSAEACDVAWGWQWSAGCDVALAHADSWRGPDAQPPCYVRGKDLLVPSPAAEHPETTRFLNQSLAQLPRDKLMYFSGMMDTWFRNPAMPHADAGYSGGVRQTIYKLYKDDPRFSLHNGTDKGWTYWQRMSGATFCLAPAGMGWGARFKTSVTRGCIPLIIQDGLKVEWEDVLPLKEFALRMPSAWMHRLPDILDQVVRSPGKVERMQQALRCVWPLFWWSRPHGRAFELTMCVLHARLVGAEVQLDLQSCTVQCGPGSTAWKVHGQQQGTS